MRVRISAADRKHEVEASLSLYLESIRVRLDWHVARTRLVTCQVQVCPAFLEYPSSFSTWTWSVSE